MRLRPPRLQQYSCWWQLIFMETYVIKSENGKYIAIDTASGGYPYETERIQGANIWSSKEDAYDYKNKFPKENWTLHNLIINTIPTRWF
jgi:hypothetical protein